jgi:hypothetical protein
MNTLTLKPLYVILVSLTVSPLFSPKKEVPSKISCARKKLTAARAYGASHSDESDKTSDDSTERHLPRIASSLSSVTASRSSTFTQPGVETTFTIKQREERLKKLKAKNAKDLTREAKSMFKPDPDIASPRLEDFFEDPEFHLREITSATREMHKIIAKTTLKAKDRKKLEDLVTAEAEAERQRARAEATFLVERRARNAGRIEHETTESLTKSELFSPRGIEDIMGRARLERIHHNIRKIEAQEARRARAGERSEDEASD